MDNEIIRGAKLTVGEQEGKMRELECESDTGFTWQGRLKALPKVKQMTKNLFVTHSPT